VGALPRKLRGGNCFTIDASIADDGAEQGDGIL
jgi:hypothetical protein